MKETRVVETETDITMEEFNSVGSSTGDPIVGNMDTTMLLRKMEEIHKETTSRLREMEYDLQVLKGQNANGRDDSQRQSPVPQNDSN